MLAGAIFSVLTITLASCSKSAATMSVPEVMGRTNVWTGNGNPKLSEEPTFYQIDGTNSFQFDGKITGLGNADDVTITIEASVWVDPSCHNPGNGDVVKGVSRPVLKPVSFTYPLKNGRFDFSLHTDPVTVDDLLDDVCPNGNWTKTIDGVSLKSYTIKLNGLEFYSKTIF